MIVLHMQDRTRRFTKCEYIQIQHHSLGLQESSLLAKAVLQGSYDCTAHAGQNETLHKVGLYANSAPMLKQPQHEHLER